MFLNIKNAEDFFVVIFKIKNFDATIVFSKRLFCVKVKEERITCDRMESHHCCRRRVSCETKITAISTRLRDEIRNKEHLVPRVADPSCEGRPFLVDACPRIVTPAYAKPRPRMPLPGLRGSSPFTSLSSDAFLHVRHRESSRRHVPRHGPNLSNALRRETIKV